MKKGQSKRVWQPEQKADNVHKYLNDHISVRILEKKHHTDCEYLTLLRKMLLRDDGSQ